MLDWVYAFKTTKLDKSKNITLRKMQAMSGIIYYYFNFIWTAATKNT